VIWLLLRFSQNMLPSRKKFRFQAVPSDRQLWAIGMVAVQWSLLEGHIKGVAHGLYGVDAASRDEFDQTLVFRHRLRMVRDLISNKIMEPFRTDLLAIIDRVGSIAQERDKIIHGTWSSTQPPPPQPDDPPPSHEATHVSGTAKPKPAFEWKLNYERILETALKIDGVTFDLMNYLAHVVGRPRQFLMSEALRRISRNPHPGN
jgi:hypothetical protein